jgi:hypothetical protein
MHTKRKAASGEAHSQTYLPSLKLKTVDNCTITLKNREKISDLTYKSRVFNCYCYGY